MQNALEISGLRKRYKGFCLQDVSFSVPAGSIMGLVGPNGAGKTTIVKLIMNLVRRDAGEIRVFGQESLSREPQVKSRIGFVYDAPPFYDDLRPKEIAAAIAPFYPGWDEPLFRRLAGEFGLSLDKRIKALSQGQKMKFSLALALCHGADLIVMDEPTAGLDPVFRRELLDRFRALLQDEGKAILFSTHITSDLERVADMVTFIAAGRILFSATMEEIRERWAVVRGGDELLGADLQPLFLSLRKGAYGAAALTSQRQRIPARPGQVVERPTLDEIMVFLGQGGAHADS
jgi:ABC-2 type transport system ATP-binding protein